MRIVQPSYEILTPDEVIMSISKHIERCGRVCYKSEDKITDSSAATFCAKIVASHHESVVEHASLTVKFVCDRGVSHEIVRHRVASFSQESTRFCDYASAKFGRDVAFIEPFFFAKDSKPYAVWKTACEEAEKAYFSLRDSGCTAQEARSVLPNSLKTEIIVTANIREWRHIMKERTSKAAHPQMRQLMVPLNNELAAMLPEFFTICAS